jgi:hypothetical protein
MRVNEFRQKLKLVSMYKIPKPPVLPARETPESLLRKVYELMCNSNNVADHSELLLAEEHGSKYYFGFTTMVKVCYNLDHIYHRDEFEVSVDTDSGNIGLIYVPSGHYEVLEFSQFSDFCGLQLDSRVPFHIGEEYFTIKCRENERLVPTELMARNYEFIWDTEKFILPLGPGGDAKEVYRDLCELVYDINGLNFDNTDILFVPKS